MRIPLLAVALLAATPLLAQGNAVPGMDARVYEVTDISYYGRRGAAYPNGEAGLVMGHSYCNTGTVDIPWVSSIGSRMVDTYPKIAFLLARESGGRMVQVSGPSYLKHSVTPYNFNTGPCLPCNGGSGGFMFQGCSDTYSSGINSNRNYLAPTSEVDPWLGTWNPVGSYFDRGDPAVSGLAASDGVKSLTSSMTNAFDPVKNRLEVREGELATPGSFYGQVQLVIQGEPVANRANNVVSRPMAFAWNGSDWSGTTTGASTEGSVLTRWTGATWEIGGNGNDDGRHLVAVKVTGPVGGMYHYEYAVHNLDNARAGASFRVPLDAGATLQNVGSRDIDGNPLNDWTWSRSSGELAFLAAANNALEWNTLYNFWFDCSVAPSFGAVQLDCARPGPGLPSVVVASRVPSGVPTAYVTSVGASCGSCASSVYEDFPSATGFDLANQSMTLTLSNGSYTLGAGTGSWVNPAGNALALGDDSEAAVPLPFALPYPGGSTTQLLVCSNGFISPAQSNGTDFTPSVAEFLAGNPRWAGAWHDLNPGAGGQVLVQSSASAVIVSWNAVNNFSGGGTASFQFQFLPNGTVHVLWRAMNLAGNGYLVGWTRGGGDVDPGNRDLSTTLSTPYSLCAGRFTGISLGASARPVLGTTINLVTSNIPAGTSGGVTLLWFNQATPPIDLSSIGMTGCFAHGSGPAVDFAFGVTGTTASVPLAVPAQSSFSGLGVVAETFTYSPPLTPLGVIASNGLVLVLGVQ